MERSRLSPAQYPLGKFGDSRSSLSPVAIRVFLKVNKLLVVMQSIKLVYVGRATFLSFSAHLCSTTQNAKTATTQKIAGCALIKTQTTRSRKIRILWKSGGLSTAANPRKRKSTKVSMWNRYEKFGRDSQVQAEKLRQATQRIVIANSKLTEES